MKRVDLSDKPAKKLFVVEDVELGTTKYKLAEALTISRQTIKK
jgi:DNA-binding XRE family transcriptional regulator